MSQRWYTLIALIWSFSLAAFSEHSFLTYRSQGVSLGRYNASWLRRCTSNNAVVGVTYTQSFDPCALSRYFFGAKSVTFSGSRVANRSNCDILADYFGLPADFKSSLLFNPIIRNVITDIDMYWLVGCSDNPRFTVRAIFPITYSQWNLNACEQVLDAGTADYPAGYLDSTFMAHDDLPNRALEVLSGSRTFGDLILPLYYGRIPTCKQSKTKLADIFFAFGYNILCNDNYMFTADINTTIPTGTISHARTLFEPQVGNGHHWGLGIGLSGWYTAWDSAEHNSRLSLNIDARVQHLFASTQKRSYDLTNNGPGSRYMLLQDMAHNISIAQGFSAAFPLPTDDLLVNQYIGRLVYAVDALTFDSKIKINAQAEIVAKISGLYKNMNFELGYNFWIRTKEQLLCREQLRHQSYGIKGDVQLYGYLLFPGLSIPIPGNATQSQATIRVPQGNGNTINNFINANADNPALMYNAGGPMAQTTPESVGPSTPNTGVTANAQVNGSKQAIVLSDADINNCSALSPQALSNMIFGSVRYEWETTRTYPYITVGAQGEFANKSAVSQWAVWVKGGVQY